MLTLNACGRGRMRIAAELGCSRNIVKRWLAGGDGRRSRPRGGRRSASWRRGWRSGSAGNAGVVCHELAAEKGIRVSLRTVERVVTHRRREPRAEARATVRFEGEA